MHRRAFIRQVAIAGVAAHLPFTTQATTAPARCNRDSTAEEVTKGLELTGKVAVVTGCNSGIGFETMRVLALCGAHVIGTARTLDKGKEACARIKGEAIPVVLELTDFDSVAACAKAIRDMVASVDMLILNAGIVLDDWQQVNGLEKQFVVNHLGHFILTQRLLDRVTAAEQGRVVVVGSGNHRDAPAGGIQFDDLSGRGWYKRGYAHSKLANGLFSLQLSQRLRGTRATSNCLTPGPVDTNIRRDLPASSAPANLKSPAQGAATVCYVAAHPSLKHVSGEYFSDCKPAPQSADQTNRAMAAKLWQVSTELTRDHLA
ncbi:SDR family NAD(P)-dependent oxidoreductase [Steroidobacter sp. S1-65]|uniref:SDR family NAD(P)-dependent oxidoreductase n=1 Tax=Steroidobacter gossypii TaxID=2805490 RepID=A0ABS1X657_9GAMM|nr:SDR family NAD(P)-dependent oxidoreductase [Steroidobacter gossypii]MBM0108694.1 SDR family NAD(P)-dependent oxidoreductase [Steroidobacter gossypii]